MSDEKHPDASETDAEPKLIIDEDYKARVQREKAELEKQKAAAASSPSPAEVADEQPQPTSEKHESTQALPPASLPMLIASLGTQAMAALGQIPGDDGQPMPVNLDFAKHFIDLIGVIETKTTGNLSDDEKRYLQDSLYQLRLAFVEVKKRAGK